MTREEAIQIVKTTKDWSELRLALQELVPELRESEDERIRKELTDFVNHYRHNTDLTSEQAEWCKKALVYLEKQKEQKPAEWSEEDEKILHAIELHVGQLDSGETINGFSSSDMLRILKSLRPQPHWKPGEEQMNYLCAAVDAAIRKHNESVSGYRPARVLKSLYEDLKKLM